MKRLIVLAMTVITSVTILVPCALAGNVNLDGGRTPISCLGVSTKYLNTSEMTLTLSVGSSGVEVDDYISVTAYVTRNEGGMPTVYHDRFFFGGDAVAYEDITLNWLSPNSRYDIRIDFSTSDGGVICSTSYTEWTPPKKLKKSAVKKAGKNKYKWKKVKGAKGYVVLYSYLDYVGKKRGKRVYEQVYAAYTVKKNRVKLDSGERLHSITPYMKHNGYCYAQNTAYESYLMKYSSVSGMVGAFMDRDGAMYYFKGNVKPKW